MSPSRRLSTRLASSHPGHPTPPGGARPGDGDVPRPWCTPHQRSVLARDAVAVPIQAGPVAGPPAVQRRCTVRADIVAVLVVDGRGWRRLLRHRRLRGRPRRHRAGRRHGGRRHRRHGRGHGRRRRAGKVAGAGAGRWAPAPTTLAGRDGDASQPARTSAVVAMTVIRRMVIAGIGPGETRKGAVNRPKPTAFCRSPHAAEGSGASTFRSRTTGAHSCRCGCARSATGRAFRSIQ